MIIIIISLMAMVSNFVNQICQIWQIIEIYSEPVFQFLMYLFIVLFQKYLLVPYKAK